MGDGARDSVMFVAFGIVTLASVLGILRSLQPFELISRVQALLRSARERVASFHEASTSEVGLLVQTKMRQLKVEHIQWCMRAFCICITPLGVLGMYEIASSQPRLNTMRRDILYVLTHGLFAVVLNFPGIVCWRSVDFLTGTVSLMSALYASPWFCTPDNAMVSIVAAIGMTILLNIVRRSVLTSAAFNSLVAISVMSTTMVCGQTLVKRPWLLAVVELLILVAFPTFAYILDVSIGINIQNGLEMQAANEVHSAASALLRSCCDVMVELDPKGTILNSALDLGGFLLRGPSRCFKGSKLSDLFSSQEDRAKFLSKLCAPEPSDIGLAEAIHVHMRDGNDELLRVELLWFGFRHLDGARHFMVGLREYSDFGAAGAQRSRRREPARGEGSSPESSASRHREGSEESRPPRSEASESRGTPGQADAEVGASEGRAPSGSMEVQAASVTVDATVRGYPVHSYSAGFRSRIGRLQLGSSFLDALCDKEDLVRWVQLAMYSASIGGEVPDHQVTLDMRQGQLNATCRIALEPGEEITLRHLELVFFDIRPCRGRSRGRHDVGSRTPSHLRGTPVGLMSL